MWGMYEESNNARIYEKIENAKLVKSLSEENTPIY